MVQNSSQTLMISDMGLSMSVPTHLLRMSSPVLSVLLDQPPCLTTSLILPDAYIKTLAVLIELLSKGKTKESSSSMISPLNDLADLLGISNFNVDAKEIANSAHDSRKPLKKEEKVNRGLKSGKPQQKDVINLNDTLNADPTDVEENKSICFKCDKTFSSSSNLIFHICTHFTDDLKVFIEEDQSCRNMQREVPLYSRPTETHWNHSRKTGGYFDKQWFAYNRHWEEKCHCQWKKQSEKES